jgi:hypothetical protein
MLTCKRLTLASFETGIRFANHKDFTATTNDFAVTVAGLGRFQGIQDFHGIFQKQTSNKKTKVYCKNPVKASAC